MRSCGINGCARSISGKTSSSERIARLRHDNHRFPVGAAPIPGNVVLLQLNRTPSVVPDERLRPPKSPRPEAILSGVEPSGGGESSVANQAIMKQTLQLRIGQHLAMTPQLQQAIKLLQLSTLELQAEVQDALDSNLMLETAEDDQDAAQDAADGGNGADAEVSPADIPNELPVDSVWEDIYDSGSLSLSGSDFGVSDLEAQRPDTGTLKDHLFWQMSILRFTETDQIIGAAIIDGIDDDGYLSVPADDVRQSLLAEGLDVALDEVEACLRQVQNFDPPGVAARDLRECLTIQLLQYPVDTPWRAQAIQLVSEHLATLASKEYPQLAKALRLDLDQLREVVGLIRSLTPRPGASIQSSAPEYVIPDVFVRKVNGAWRVELNPEAFPKVRVNAQYAGLIKRADNSADNTTLKTHLQEARWFIKSLRSRSETLLKVATTIVNRQRNFLDYGEEGMKPMVLHDVAEAVGMPRVHDIASHQSEVHAHPPRDLRAQVLLFESRVHDEWRRVLVHRHSRPAQEADRGGESR